MELSTVIKKIKHCLEKEDRKDVEFRALIALTELGDIVKYITHDAKLNPNARPHGSRKDETLAYGQALVQTIATMILRGINLREAFSIGLKNWEQGDWRGKTKKRNKISTILTGTLAFSGNATGKAYILSDSHPIEKLPRGSILVANTIKPDMVSYLARVAGIITDQGGKTSHGAIISKEQRIPCIVGTGNATVLIPHRKNIQIIAKKKKGLIKLA